MNEQDCKLIDDIREHLASQNPGWRPTRSDAVRFAIASSMGVAVPIASTMPPEKPRRSG